MNFVDAIKSCFVHYADFKGRAGRPEFWWFALFTVTGAALLSLFSDPLGFAFLAVTLLPSFAVGTRRLHDAGRGGWWQVLWIVPLIGWLALIFHFAQPSRQDDAQ